MRVCMRVNRVFCIFFISDERLVSGKAGYCVLHIRPKQTRHAEKKTAMREKICLHC